MDALFYAAQRLCRLLPRRHPSREEEFFQAPTKYGIDLNVTFRMEVLPAIAEALNRPSFRQLATYAVTSLAPGAPSEERQLLVQVLGRLCRVIVEMRAFLVARQQAGHVWPTEVADDIERRLAGIEMDADAENVSADDYFQPAYRTRDRVADQSIQRGEFIVAYQPLLNHVGNIIARSMLVRLNSMLGGLNRIGRAIQQLSAVLPESTPQPDWAISLAEAQALTDRLEGLTVTSRQARNVEAAMTLVQVTAGLSDAALDLSWLEVDEILLRSHQLFFPSRLCHSRGVATVARIVQALERVAAYLDLQPEEERELERAIADGKLVIHVSRKELYWKGSPFSKKLAPQSFQLLVALARRRRSYNTMEDLGFPDRSEQAAYSAFHRLRRDVPSTLEARINNGDNGRFPSYRLCLDASELLIVQ